MGTAKHFGARSAADARPPVETNERHERDVRDVIADFLRHHRRQSSPGTVRVYRAACDQLVAWLEGTGRSTALGEIHRGTLDDWVDALIARVDARTGRVIRPSTVKVRVDGIRRLFNYAVNEGVLDVSPAAKVRGPRVPEAFLAPADAAALGELLAYLDSLPAHDARAQRDTAIVRLLATTALRRFEVAALLVADVDLDGDEPFVVVRTTKTRRARVVPLMPRTAESLRRWLRLRCSHRHAGTGLLFLAFGSGASATADGHLSGDAIGRLVGARCREAGVAPITPHSLRRLAACEWLEAGVSEGDVEVLAGWSAKSRMIDRYTKAAAQKRALRRARAVGRDW